MQKTKKFTFGITYQAHGRVTVHVPADLDLEGAKQYIQNHWIGMYIPKIEYIQDSDDPDFENANFEDDEDDEED